MCEVLGGEERLILVCEVNKLNLINKILNEEEENKISYCVIAGVNPENMVMCYTHPSPGMLLQI